MSWLDDAACKGHENPELWYPTGKADGSPRRQAADEAIGICLRKCTVRKQCAEFALKTDRNFGVWAGIDLGDNASAGAPSATQKSALKAMAGVSA